MKTSYYTIMGALSAVAAGTALLTPRDATAQVAPLQAPADQGTEELTRGPVHEAFAATVSFDPVPGALVNTGPPQPIEEIPPDQRPAGDNVTWIPGYWGWDEDAGDFIWISGVWRNLPPGRQWVPGYWAAAGTQWRWISGYWADEETDEVVYLPKPPRTVETGPNVQAPSENHLWISGTWVHRQERYAWRPGYWEPARSNWIWIPAHYLYTPRGYVFVDGYWDYQVARRGVIFAPVRFDRHVYERPDYFYQPSTVISLAIFAQHLFVRPDYGHYYFGDYYAPRYRDRGYYAPFHYHSTRGYDPIYAHARWEHRDDRNWERLRRERFDYYRSHEEARPPRTWSAMRNRARDDDRREDNDFAQSYASYVRRADERQRFEPVTAEFREKVVSQRQEVRKFAETRRKIETQSDERPEKERSQTRRERFTKSPVVGKPMEEIPDALQKRSADRDAPRTTDRDQETRRGIERAADAPGLKTERGDPEAKDRQTKMAEELPAKPKTEDRPTPGRRGEVRERRQPETRASEPEKTEVIPTPPTERSRNLAAELKRRTSPPPSSREPGTTRRIERPQAQPETRPERKVVVPERKLELVPQAPKTESRRPKQETQGTSRVESRVISRPERQETRASKPAGRPARELPPQRQVERKQPARQEAPRQIQKTQVRPEPTPVTPSRRENPKSQRTQKDE